MMESFIQSPREGVGVKPSGTYGYSSSHSGGQVPRRAELERSMLAYTEKARVLISTSLPEGLNYSPRAHHLRAVFNPVTWARGGMAGHQASDYSTDYSFPNFKEREDVMSLARRNLREKSSLKLFIGNGDPPEISRGSKDRPKTFTESPVKPSRMARKAKRTNSVASVQTDKAKAKSSSVASVQTDKAKAKSSSVASVQTDKAKAKSSVTAYNDDTLTATTLDKGTTTATSLSYQMALEGGLGPDILLESDASGPVLSNTSRLQERRGETLQKGAYSIGRLFPPRQQPRKRKKKRNRKSPIYLMVGHAGTQHDNDCSQDAAELAADKKDMVDKEEEGVSGDTSVHTKQSAEGLEMSDSIQRKCETETTGDVQTAIETHPIENQTSSDDSPTDGTHTNTVYHSKRKGRQLKVVQPALVSLPPVDGQTLQVQGRTDE